MRRCVIVILGVGFFFAHARAAERAIPPGFVYLRQVAPEIQQDMRYAGPHNFTGKPVPGYKAGECLLLYKAAIALKRAQAQAMAEGFSLKVYDCYRPSQAGETFIRWVASPDDGATRHFYPRLDKAMLTKGYIARRSAHSRGVAVDITLVPQGSAVPTPAGTAACTAPQSEREADNSVDMGTAYDCFDAKSAMESPDLTDDQRRFRRLLKAIMGKAGFENYPAEWWHYSYPALAARQSFDLPIQPYHGAPAAKP